MNRGQQILYALNSYSVGILLPVLTLLLLAKGANLETLPLLLAVYALTVLLMEVPSGMCADMIGRKKVFLISSAFLLGSFVLLLFSDTIILLIAAIILFGLGRAFSSGSLDALFIEQAVDLHGEAYLTQVTGRLAILESAGLALGSISGGLLFFLTGSYNSNLVLRLMLTVVIVTLCIIVVKENRKTGIPDERGCEEKERVVSLKEILIQSRTAITKTPKLCRLFIGIFFTGFLLFTMETYWQPAFMDMNIVGKQTWILGFITFLGFLSVIIGSRIAQKKLGKIEKKWWRIYNGSRFVLSFVVIFFAFQRNVGGFLAGYSFLYLFLGVSNVAENSLINQYTPNSIRASILSVASLISQIGGLCASLFSSLMIVRLNFSGIWMTAGVALGVYALYLAATTSGLNLFKRKKGI